MDITTQLAIAHTLPGVTHHVLRKLKGSPNDLWTLIHAPTSTLLAAYKIRIQHYQTILDTVSPLWQRRIQETLQTHAIHLSLPEDHHCTYALTRIEDAPALLYSTAPLTNITNPIGVVGARAMTQYGREVVEYFVKSLTIREHTIISGYAYGVDQTAHNAASLLEQESIAVLGCGLDVFLRKTPTLPAHVTFCTDFPLGTGPNRFTFPMRNRIISGLSKGVLIVEAREKSGTLTTAHYTLRQGKPLWIVPGDIFSEMTKGSYELLKQGLGTLVTHPQDIIQNLPTATLTPVQQKILAVLPTPYAFSTLRTQTKLDSSILQNELDDLVYKGKLHKVHNMYTHAL